MTSSAAGGGLTAYTCHFSHGGEGTVTWTLAAKTPAKTTARTTSRTTTKASPVVRTTRTPTARPQAVAVDSAAAANARAIDAFRAEVARRGGQATVRRAGNRNEVVVKAPGLVIEFQVSVRARTSGDFQTTVASGKRRRPEEFPTRFWVFVDLFPGATNFYIAPEWWVQNDIFEKHQAQLEAHEGVLPEGEQSVNHSIDTSRVQEWAGLWKQLGL